MGAKMNVLNQINCGLVAFDNPVQQLLRVIGKFLFSVWPFDTHLHLPSPPDCTSAAPGTAVRN